MANDASGPLVGSRPPLRAGPCCTILHFGCILRGRCGDPPDEHAEPDDLDPDDELVQHARALRGLARALVGAEHADDVMQDAAMQVLRRRPACRCSVGWRASCATVP